ncbi:unnamed protein product [Peniophora sp. CBMAI 1063]|nr:unnamed protein product [Peniophora sp. CBMAI 1063]
MERALVSYDDIQAPPPPTAPVAGPSAPPQNYQQNQQQNQPPRKKRRNNKQNRGGGGGNNQQNVNGYNGGGYSGNGWNGSRPHAHWDDPSASAVAPGFGGAPQYQQPQQFAVASLPAKPLPTGPRAQAAPAQEEYYEEEEYAEENADEEGEGDGEGEMSRMLTREEIWDDRALIDAWEAATAEYEAMHGKSQAWKTEPVKKWYNVPPKPARADAKGKSKAEEPANGDSRPFDFNTFVPTHDASLGVQKQTSGAAYQHGVAAGAEGGGEVAWAGRDEAFGQAMSAMYWAGYWSAVYHSHNRTTAKHATADEEEIEGEDVGMDGEEDDDDEAVIASPVDDDIIPTQR